ncbi:MAG TPA: GspE/PulE family protein [Candidatus Saccharimonadia bacterium]|jgi:type IV pilus assembly protein PilB|nr:GspE/PulE family protein [Candidatus Saccharimonadia bacterium]
MRISDAELKKLLIDSGLVKPDALDEATPKEGGESLQAAVLKKKLISEKDLTKLYAKSIDIPFAELGDVKIPREILLKIPERIARKYQVILFGVEEDQMQLAMADPEDFQAADFITKQVGGKLKTYIATPSDILGAIDQYKGEISTEITKAIKDSSSEAATEEKVSAKDLAEDAPIAKTVNVILEYAVKSRASDIHIEPRENIVQVRYRVDGVLRETMTLPKPILAAVVSRIKILANLKIDEHRVPQDGRFKFAIGSKAVALRVSTLPIMDGEKVVMRILDESARALTLEELGFTGHALETIVRNLHKPHGMTLVTGPTGSGKSTTLYSVLSLLNTPGVNISTVEDPVEYRVTGVNQTQVNPKTGMTFAAGLRALLRQDPNIIMVGEIRDGETADLAVQAALTGHVVLSTLHTNNAATTLPRLLDMGIEPFLIASTVNTVIGQRLVRRLCQVCRISYVPEGVELTNVKRDFQLDAALKRFNELKGTPDPAPAPAAAPVSAAAPAPAIEPTERKKGRVINPEHDIDTGGSILDKIAADPNIINRSAADAGKPKGAAAAAPAATAPAAAPAPAPPPPKIDPKDLKAGQFMLFKPGAGCEACGGAAYQGRMGIYEVLEVDEAISKMIVGRATADDIQIAAVRAGMLTMQQDGFVKALQGKTTIEEILRVTRE